MTAPTSEVGDGAEARMMTRLRAIILGAAAGGGLPKGHCGCANCEADRQGEIPRATQSSLAVTANGHDWAILNASPDIGEQLVATPALHPTGLRKSPLKAVLLTNADLDHVAGLLTLREKQPFQLFATSDILGVIAANPVFGAPDPAWVTGTAVALEAPFELRPGLQARL
ncbi:MBL fold metallo-hydrolase, partial [Thiohalocapsa sp.]|uniref:MBL fold metallo-hydrolase n=1 Tax=Thiohalocapsa sp. TaxID=2497641 RepID=UPI0025D7A3EB